MTISPNSSQHHHRGRLRQGSGTGIEAGHVIAFRREDGASMLRYQIAKGKASGALGLGVSSPKIGEMALERPSFVASVGTVAPHWVISVAGGIIVTGRDGQLLRAVGVTGETSDNDDVCALAGIAAALLTPQR